MASKLRSYRSRLLDALLIPEEAAHYVNAALADSAEMFLEALKDVVQAHQVATVAKQAGVTREHIYKSFSLEGNPTWDTLNKVLPVIGLKLEATTKKTVQQSRHTTKAVKTGYRTRATGRQRTSSEAQMSLPFSPSASGAEANFNLISNAQQKAFQPGIGIVSGQYLASNADDSGASSFDALVPWLPPPSSNPNYFQSAV
jgi:probable addiction module antidote protein